MSNAVDTISHRRGIFKSMPIDDYHAAEGISNSGISLILEAPKKYWHEYLNKENLSAKEEESKALSLGSAVHTLALEPLLFPKLFHVYPKLNRTTKDGKRSYIDHLQLAEGRRLITESEYVDAKAMADAIRSNPAFMRVVGEGHIEDSLFWESNGVTLRSRPDFYNDFIIVDIKTTQCAKPEVFQKSIAQYGYHRQGAMQIDALNALTANKYQYFAILAVEKSPPYLNAMYLLDIEAIERGREEYLHGVDIYKHCLTNNTWPGYSTKLESIHLPAWYMARSNED